MPASTHYLSSVSSPRFLSLGFETCFSKKDPIG
jgi:hypothetical protein